MTSSSMPDRLPLPLKVLRLGPAAWLDLSRAVVELARARRRLGRHSGPDLIRQGRRPVRGRPLPPAEAEALVERVAFAVPRVAAHLPWRADCWIQAMAAQSWLGQGGVASDIFIGVRQDRGSFEAHAWLRRGDRIVTGGEVKDFVPLVTPTSPID